MFMLYEMRGAWHLPAVQISKWDVMLANFSPSKTSYAQSNYTARFHI